MTALDWLVFHGVGAVVFFFRTRARMEREGPIGGLLLFFLVAVSLVWESLLIAGAFAWIDERCGCYRRRVPHLPKSQALRRRRGR